MLRCSKPVKDTFPRSIWCYTGQNLQFVQHDFHAEVLRLCHEPLVKLGIFGHIWPRRHPSAKICKDMLKELCIGVNEVDCLPVFIFSSRPSTKRTAETSSKVGRTRGQRRFVRVEEVAADVQPDNRISVFLIVSTWLIDAHPIEGSGIHCFAALPLPAVKMWRFAGDGRRTAGRPETGFTYVLVRTHKRTKIGSFNFTCYFPAPSKAGILFILIASHKKHES